MKKILLTGFEPFLNYTTNPTQEIVKALDEMQIGEYGVCGVVLPVVFKEAGQALMSEIKSLQPDVIVSLGLAGGRAQITPERIAININDGPVDNDGYKPVDEEIVVGGDAGYFSTLPIRAMVEALREKGLPAEISNTAGAYVCNNVMYQALHYANQQRVLVRAGFIHVPASHELAVEKGNIPSWSMEDLIEGVRVCLGELI